VIAQFSASPAILSGHAGRHFQPGAYPFIKIRGIESWVRLSASRSHWFFSQTSRWRTRRIIGTTTTLITIITITTIDSG
jgi:hypothetical protein